MIRDKAEVVDQLQNRESDLLKVSEKNEKLQTFTKALKGSCENLELVIKERDRELAALRQNFEELGKDYNFVNKTSNFKRYRRDNI